MPPDFLNSREDAILIWAVVGLVYVLRKDFRGIGGSLVAVARSLLHPKLLLLFGSALAYSGALVYAASRLGLWHSSALKPTIYWYIGTAAVLAGEAVTDGTRGIGKFPHRQILARVLTVTIVVEFIANVYALPLAVELASVLLVFVFGGVQVVAQLDPATPRATLKFIEGVLIAVGLFYLGYFIVRVFGDFNAFLTRDNAEDFLTPPALTLALIPFLCVAAWRSRREQENLRNQFRARFNSPA
jgi:hypothetical protein